MKVEILWKKSIFQKNPLQKIFSFNFLFFFCFMKIFYTKWNVNVYKNCLISSKKYLLSFGSIACYIHIHYLILHINTWPSTYNLTKRKQILFLHFINWPSWQRIMSIFWSWNKTRKRLFPTLVQALVQNMSFFHTVKSGLWWCVYGMEQTVKPAHISTFHNTALQSWL